MSGLEVFADPGLTRRLTRLEFMLPADGGDAVIYVGGGLPGRRFRDAANPGVAPIELAIVDGGGSPLPPSAVRLALAPAALDTAEPGAALALAVEIPGGVAGAVAVYVRVAGAALAAGVYDGLLLATGEVLEEVV